MCSLFVTERAHDEAMPAIFDRILPLNVVANTAIFYLAARLYLWPQLPRFRPQQILIPILLLHSTRHLGMMFLTRGATYPGLPWQFAYPAAFGDLLTAIIALVTIPIVLRRSSFAKPAVWVFNVLGTIDPLVAIVLALGAMKSLSKSFVSHPITPPALWTIQQGPPIIEFAHSN